MYKRTTSASRRQEAVAARRWFHISCEARMIENPQGSHLPMIPYISSGITYKKKS